MADAPANLVLYNPQGNVPLSERKTAALELMTCREREVVIKGPARTGKSLAMVHRMNAVLAHYAGARGLMVRKTRSSLNEAALADYEEKVVPRNLAVYPDTRTQQRKIRSVYEYPNGSVLVVAGMDTPERIMSTEYDIVAVQETTELAEHDWELLVTRLSHGKIPFYQQIMGDMNPTYPTHWINKRIAAGITKMLYSRHEDNPRWWDGTKWTVEGERYIENLKRGLSGVRYLRLFKGVDAAAEGAVYPDFNFSDHTEPGRVFPRDWRRIRTIDFGFRHPFVCQWWAIDPDGKMYRYREIFYSQRIVEDHAKQIIKLSGNERYEATIADHDAEGRATLHKMGIRTVPAFKAVRLGIDAVTQRLRDKRIVFLRDGEFEGERCGRVEKDPLLAEIGRPTGDGGGVRRLFVRRGEGGDGGERGAGQGDGRRNGRDAVRRSVCG
jgi:hypothetical protein